MTVLAEILARKRVEVAERRARVSESAMEKRAFAAADPRGLWEALSPRGGKLRVISEIKRASPSVGEIDSKLDAPALARRYADAGAAAISVLTDGPGFGGSLDDLRAVRVAVAFRCSARTSSSRATSCSRRARVNSCPFAEHFLRCAVSLLGTKLASLTSAGGVPSDRH